MEHTACRTVCPHTDASFARDARNVRIHEYTNIAFVNNQEQIAKTGVFIRKRALFDAVCGKILAFERKNVKIGVTSVRGGRILSESNTRHR